MEKRKISQQLWLFLSSGTSLKAPLGVSNKSVQSFESVGCCPDCKETKLAQCPVFEVETMLLLTAGEGQRDELPCAPPHGRRAAGALPERLPSQPSFLRAENFHLMHPVLGHMAGKEVERERGRPRPLVCKLTQKEINDG